VNYCNKLVRQYCDRGNRLSSITTFNTHQFIRIAKATCNSSQNNDSKGNAS
jgi:hypothetical protein